MACQCSSEYEAIRAEIEAQGIANRELQLTKHEQFKLAAMQGIIANIKTWADVQAHSRNSDLTVYEALEVLANNIANDMV